MLGGEKVSGADYRKRGRNVVVSDQDQRVEVFKIRRDISEAAHETRADHSYRGA